MKNTKRIILGALIIFGMSISSQLSSQATPTYTDHISLVSPGVTRSTDIVILSVLTNVSDHNILRTGEEDVYPFKLVIRDEQGNLVKETDYGMKVHGSIPHQVQAPHLGAPVIKKGESVSGKIDLSKEFDLSAPGVYTVYITDTDRETRLQVTSNVLTFTVQPK